MPFICGLSIDVLEMNCSYSSDVNGQASTFDGLSSPCEQGIATSSEAPIKFISQDAGANANRKIYRLLWSLPKNGRKKTMAKERKETSISFNGDGVCVTPEEDVTTSTSQKAATAKRGVVAVVTAEQIRRERYFELMAGQPLGPHVFTRQKK